MTLGPEEILQREAQMLGRGVTHRDFWQCVFSVQGEEHAVEVAIYDADPLDLEAHGRRMHESRVAVYIDGHPSGSGIVTTAWEDRDGTA